MSETEPVQYTFHHGIPIVVAAKDKDKREGA